VAELDLDSIRERYRLERDKRLRADANAQFRGVDGELAHYADDPYADSDFERAPVAKDVEVLVVGAGIAGILAAAQLRMRRISDLCILEQAADFGGTWYWNRYPGAMCDVESYIYLPLLEETGYVPTSKYVFGTEIRAYLQSVAHRYGLYERAYLQTAITGMEWDDGLKRWRVGTDRDDDIRARFVIVSNGPLTRPKLPGIPGIETFKGASFHTSRWDFDYTGGDTLGGLDRLHDKRVAVIGTGCTGVQCVPYLAEAAEHLYVVQRTPASCDYRNNRPTDPAWWKEQTRAAGWQVERMRNFTSIVSGGQEPVDLVDDGWTYTFQELTGVAVERAAERLGRPLTREERTDLLELADARTMERIRDRIEAEVADRRTAELLKPWYKRWCKRPMWHDEYLATFNRPNVTLIDTDGQGPDRITATSLVVGEEEYKLDCLIFATGFEVGTNYVRRIGYDIIGRSRRRLSEKWADGMRTFHGLHVHDFPNVFFLGTTQTGVTANYAHQVRQQAEHVAYIVTEARERGRAIEATQDAEDWWVAEVRRLARHGRRYYEECTPGYLTAEGKLDDPYGLLANTYGDGPVKFFQLLEDWRTAGTLEGLAITP
jgi:cation diffusion facilitator CzcD-associated flavoprotein CzcO